MPAPLPTGVVRTGTNHPMGVAPPASTGAGTEGAHGEGVGGGGVPNDGEGVVRKAPGSVIISDGGGSRATAPPTSVVSTPAWRSSGRVGKTAMVPPASTHPTSASSSGPCSRASRSDGTTTTVADEYPAACSGSTTSPVVASTAGEPTVSAVAVPGDAYGDDVGRQPGVIGHPRITTESRDGSSRSTSSGASDVPGEADVSASLEPSSPSAEIVSVGVE